ncbi:zinc metallopeptidase [Fodinicurvata sp. EGI_FJ10296]|uniref:zinc metallopeptidase n=1 Tax=Fodinicurvata sp. EGI_FJ10296 TaxID=3231908 RepID=UPI0034533573
MTLWLLLGGLVLGLVFGPSLWVRRVLSRHDRTRNDFPGTGGELARHLLDEADLQNVVLEDATTGDHYDTDAKAVRLTPRVMGGRSVTAVAVAAHEVGHAIQDRDGFAPLRYRNTVLSSARTMQRVGLAVMVLAPVFGAVAGSPVAAALPLVVGVLIRGSAVLAALAALPSEFDASFQKALPILREGGYLDERDIQAASAVLRAAAFSYVANAAVQIIFAGRGGLRF